MSRLQSAVDDRVVSRQYASDLNAIVKQVFQRAQSLDWNYERLATKAGLSYVTVYNLVTCNTIYPRFHTVWKLVRAVGLQVSVGQVRASLRKAG